jgi:lysophospholipase L1-like esterase
VLVTPPPRKTCRDDGRSFNYSFGAYATAMRELAEANQVPLIELGERAVAFLDEQADCEWAGENFFLVRADGSIDSTHFQEHGANILAGLVAAGVESLKLPLSSFLK